MKIVPMIAEERQYPLIVRVVVRPHTHHFADVIRSVGEPLFSIAAVQKIFHIRRDDDWISRPIQHWSEAMSALAWKIRMARTARQDIELSPSGFFITVRPRFREIEVLYQNYGDDPWVAPLLDCIEMSA